MKKKIFAMIIFAVMVINSSIAQFSAGPKAGLNFSKFSNQDASPDEHLRAITGMNFGLAFNLPIWKIISFQPEIFFIQKGCWGESKENKNIYFKFTSNYYEVPAIFKFSYGSEKVKGFLDAGPYFAYWTRVKQVYHYDTLTTETDIYTPDNADENRLDVGLCFGGGVYYNIGPGKIMLSLRYDLGIVNIIKDMDPAMDNRTYGISLAYLFNLTKSKNEN